MFDKCWIFFFKWFPLKSVEHGEIHLQLNWLSLQTDESLLRKVRLFLIRELRSCSAPFSLFKPLCSFSSSRMTASLVQCLQFIWTVLPTYQ